MTNTKFRKRALLSSVAMLLVALVALGSATFAWFTSNPNADATGLHLKATAAKGLVIMTESSEALSSVSKTNGTGTTGWLHEDWLNVNTGRTATKTDSITLDAASINSTNTTAPAFYGVEAEADGAYNAKTTAAVNDVTASMASGGVYNEKIWCKLLGTAATSADLKLTSITADTSSTTSKSIKEALRITLYYVTAAGARSYIGTYNIVGTAQSNDSITAKGTPNTYAKATKGTVTAANLPTTTSTIGTVDQSGNCYVDCYFWLDGEDDKCFTDNVDASEIMNSVTINLTVA